MPGKLYIDPRPLPLQKISKGTKEKLRQPKQKKNLNKTIIMSVT